ncbi:MAG: Gfo/Idh/MocA family oxidoreductase [Planctomycetota bacterium]|nr:Gfo/Idh/MocA family oxidoreductase [Planctomycetota bacterium]MDA1177495.1 Gfo/Idh/MocA family oxidoreductase [Planctomycetota bacterium]
MINGRYTRRQFSRTSAAFAGIGLTVPYWCLPTVEAEPAGAGMRFAVIGTGYRGTTVADSAIANGASLVAIAETDSLRGEAYKQKTGGAAVLYGDYRRILDRKDIDFVAICTPDHWHTKMSLETMQVGKDVYCEKPLTLTIDEGKLLREAVKRSGRVFQVGTQQRTEFGSMFLKAVALCHAGRLGKIQRITCAIGAAATGGPFREQEPPTYLDWDRWLGPAPKVGYMPERAHYMFRYWYDYSGGQVTDWGVHHVDIATWALGASNSGPTTIEAKGDFQDIPHGYEVASRFQIKCTYSSGAELWVVDDKSPEFDNGLMIEGTQGRIFVNRGKLTGTAVEDLQDHPLPDDAIMKLCKGKQPGDHMRNFMECIKDRGEPVSDVASHHRSVTTCHLANIAMRLGRVVRWDDASEQIVGDDEANAWQKREQRAQYKFPV